MGLRGTNFDLKETFKMLHSKKTGVSVNNSNIDNLLKKKYTLYTSENVFKEASDGSSNKKIKTQKGSGK